MMSTDLCEKQPVKTETFTFKAWKIESRKSHILQSKCLKLCSNMEDLCSVCRYKKDVVLPQLPDMVFPNNILRLEHESGFGLEFNCLDALKLVDSKHDLMKVAVADAWREARSDSEHIKDVVNPFDWTFTTNYKGTLLGSDRVKVLSTSERIDIEKLKAKEKILFYDDIHLFEDELADNGSAELSVKIRVMPSGFFILMRYYLRVDNVLVRIHDTRIYHEDGKPYLLREFTRREMKISELKVSTSVIADPNEILMHLPIQEEIVEKLELLSD